MYELEAALASVLVFLDFFFSSRRRHTRSLCDWSSDVCSSDLLFPSARVEGNNPLCGDEIQMDVLISDGELADVAYTGRGCSISQASASMMTELVKGKPLDEVREVVASFKGMMHGDDIDLDEMGDIEALQGVRQFPVRIKCALLAWTTLQQALH